MRSIFSMLHEKKERKIEMNEKTMNLSDFAVVKNDGDGVLGKLLYFSLASVLIDRQEMDELCKTAGVGQFLAEKTSASNAWRSATGDIYDRFVRSGTICKVYCRDNESNDRQISRELVLETLGSKTNEYTKLANLYFDRRTESFRWDNGYYGSWAAPDKYCARAEDLFEKYKRCVGRGQIETVTKHMLEDMDATKLSMRGCMYFIPKSEMHKLSLFEDFVAALNDHNQHTTPLTVNSLYVTDDQKQRDKMATEFYLSLKKEIETYEERMEHLIQTGSQSRAIMNRWVIKAKQLEEKKARFEDLFRQQISGVDNELQNLRAFAQELKLRASLLDKKCA